MIKTPFNAVPVETAFDGGDELVAAFTKQYRLHTSVLSRPAVTLRLVHVPRWCLQAGSHVRAVALAQLLYWLRGRGRNGKPRAHTPDPARRLHRPRIAKPTRQLADETGLGARQVEHAMAALRGDDWIGYHPMRFHGGGELAGLTVLHVWLGSRGDQMLRQHRQNDGAEPSIWLLRWTMAATEGDLNAAMALSRLWHLSESRHDCDLLATVIGVGVEAPVVVERQADLAEWLQRSRHKIKRALAALRERDLVRSFQRRQSPVGRLQIDVQRCAPLVLEWSDFAAERRQPDGAVARTR